MSEVEKKEILLELKPPSVYKIDWKRYAETEESKIVYVSANSPLQALLKLQGNNKHFINAEYITIEQLGELK